MMDNILRIQYTQSLNVVFKRFGYYATSWYFDVYPFKNTNTGVRFRLDYGGDFRKVPIKIDYLGDQNVWTYDLDDFGNPYKFSCLESAITFIRKQEGLYK